METESGALVLTTEKEMGELLITGQRPVDISF